MHLAAGLAATAAFLALTNGERLSHGARRGVCPRHLRLPRMRPPAACLPTTRSSPANRSSPWAWPRWKARPRAMAWWVLPTPGGPLLEFLERDGPQVLAVQDLGPLGETRPTVLAVPLCPSCLLEVGQEPLDVLGLDKDRSRRATLGIGSLGDISLRVAAEEGHLGKRIPLVARVERCGIPPAVTHLLDNENGPVIPCLISPSAQHTLR